MSNPFADKIPESDLARKFLWPVAMVFWSLLMVYLAYESIQNEKEQMYSLAEAEGLANFEKDLVYRRWAAGHGGVYVPETAQTPANPYLSHIPDRDIVTQGGKKLTLVNPAYMTRQVHELGKVQYGVKGHITSLNPIRPGNSPDPWEKVVLKSFEEGKYRDFSEVADVEGQPHIRFMKALVTEERCLKCHAVQGYKVGQIRGGISVSVPLAVRRQSPWDT